MSLNIERTIKKLDRIFAKDQDCLKLIMDNRDDNGNIRCHYHSDVFGGVNIAAFFLIDKKDNLTVWFDHDPASISYYSEECIAISFMERLLNVIMDAICHPPESEDS